jgi:glycosyltransferase involved in cell wall biosynthesis
VDADREYRRYGFPLMAVVVMTDDGIEFDGLTPQRAPLGGAEAAFLSLAEALAARGHRVMVRNRCAAALTHEGVDWAPLADGLPAECDLYIANRGHRLIALMPGARRRVFWIHNPGAYLKKPRYIWPLWRHRPIIVTSGRYHASTVPRWLKAGGSVIIPYGIADAFRHATPRAVPPPRAIFTSNPLRGLDWLLDLWQRHIQPALPQAELLLYCGPTVYGSVGDAKAGQMAGVLARAESLAGKGVRRFSPLPRRDLIAALEAARVMLYRGDVNETFCLAVAEAQALGVPAVVQSLGAMPERVVDGVTGAVVGDGDGFVRAALDLLGDDALWRSRHEAALQLQRGLSWDEVAQRFEVLLP